MKGSGDGAWRWHATGPDPLLAIEQAGRHVDSRCNGDCIARPLHEVLCILPSVGIILAVDGSRPPVPAAALAPKPDALHGRDNSMPRCRRSIAVRTRARWRAQSADHVGRERCALLGPT